MAADTILFSFRVYLFYMFLKKLPANAAQAAVILRLFCAHPTRRAAPLAKPSPFWHTKSHDRPGGLPREAIRGRRLSKVGPAWYWGGKHVQES
jgi:hypothetical protein